MFSFRSLLEKVSQVQTELSDKLNTSSGSSTPDLRVTAEDNHDITAGAGLLNHYQQTWEDIHKASMDQAEHAAAAAQTINTLHTKVKYQDFLLSQLTASIIELPNLTDTIETCTTIVRETGLNISALQVELGKLEQECDKLQIERMKAVHRHHLNAYRDERQKELNNRKSEMEKAYNESMKSRVAQECMLMKERHATFGAEFQKDLQQFKSKGNLSVRDIHVKPLDTLDSFVPDEDPELSKFLESCDGTVSKLGNVPETSKVPETSSETRALPDTEGGDDVQDIKPAVSETPGPETESKPDTGVSSLEKLDTAEEEEITDSAETEEQVSNKVLQE